MEHRHVIVIGAGPAGLSAGMYSAYHGFSTLIIEEKIPGGCAAEIPLLENYPGYSEGIAGKDLVERMVQQCEKAGAEIHQFEKVIELDFEGENNVVKTDKSVYQADAMILAMGRSCSLLGIPGEEEFRGKGVSYCAVCDGYFFKGKRVIVVGYGNRSAEVAIYLSGLASDVKLLCQEKTLCAEQIIIENLEKQKVEILENMELTEIKGNINVESVILTNNKTGENKEIDIDGVFFQLEGIPNSQIAKQSGINVDENEYIMVDNKGRTNIESIYAIGDITICPTKLVVTAVSQAAVAAIEVSRYINK